MAGPLRRYTSSPGPPGSACGKAAQLRDPETRTLGEILKDGDAPWLCLKIGCNMVYPLVMSK